MSAALHQMRRTLVVLAGLLLALAGHASAISLRPGTGWLRPGGTGRLRVPVRVLLAGDSLMQGLGPQLRNTLSGYSNLTLIPIGKKSTGLSRPDFYNWPAVLKKHLEADRPHLVIMWIGTNDPQSIYGCPGIGEPCSREWQITYLNKVREIFALVRRYHARLILMGPPVVGEPELNRQLAVIHRLMEWACKRYGVCYVNTRTILADTKGLFTMQGTIPGGHTAIIRTPDRLHITADGYRRVIAFLQPYLSAELLRSVPQQR